MATVAEELDLLRAAIAARLAGKAAADSTSALSTFSELVEWIPKLEHERPSHCAGELLKGARSAMLETSAYLGLGLGRAAIGTLRAVIDLFTGYVYFSQHPLEWRRIVRTGDGFKLRSELDSFFQEHIEGFRTRLGVLEQVSGTSLKDVYRVLSAHIHGQSPLTVPKANQFAALVSSDDFLGSVLRLQSQATCAVSDYLVVSCCDDILEVPTRVMERIKAKISKEQLRILFPRSVGA